MQVTIFDLLAETWKEPRAAEPKENIREHEQNLQECEEKLQSFEDYIGKCDFCYWQRNDCDKFTCDWSYQNNNKYSYKQCYDGSFWLPEALSIPKLCGSCKFANMFCHGGEDINHPVEEPNIYCTRDDGSLNRQKPYEFFCQQGFGVGTWHRQHEWDSCDAWELDPYWGKQIENGRLVKKCN